MAYTPTPDQRRAIDCRDKTLLVSAAAGAGKTSTLTARVIESLLDREHPADLSRMLIVTFTKASAADLREHVRRALEAEAERDPQNRRAAEQLALLPTAQISTVDSFFYKILRQNAEVAGFPVETRVADTAEAALLRRDVATGMIESAYEDGLPGVCTGREFCRLADSLTDVKDEREGLTKALLAFSAACDAYPEAEDYPGALAARMKAEADLPPEQSLWGRAAMDRARDFFIYAAQASKECHAAAVEEEAANKNVLDRVLESDLDEYEHLRALAERGTYAALAEALATPTARAKLTAKVKGLPHLETFRRLRGAVGEGKKEIAQLFCVSGEEWSETMRRVAEAAGLLCRVSAEFRRRCTQEKRRRGVCEFSDLERTLYRYLIGPDGRPTEAARSVRDSFDYVYVDEYQDIDRLQHAILEACSRPDNRFMVGDVKQSIYSFRRAEPAIFAGMSRAFPSLGESDEAQAVMLHLSQNFRSDGTVIDFVNRVFDRAFLAVGQSIDFRPKEDRLVCGKGVSGDQNPRLIMVEKGPADPAEEEQPDEEEQESGAETEEEDDPRATLSEARAIAAEIRRLLALTGPDGKPRYRPGDCAVLLRVLKNKERVYVRALREAGLDVEISGEKGFLLEPEILLCLCLVNAVDNPRRDVYLAGLMRSPLYGFSQDDLTRIRLSADTDLTLWESLGVCAADAPDPRVDRLKDDLARFRAMAESLSVDRFLRRVYDETGLLALAGAGGGAGRSHLMRLCHYARAFDQNENKGLHAFIGYVNRLIDDEDAFAPPAASLPDPNKVQIMTIHKSKGLEFPVVFAAGCGAPNVKKSDGPFLLDPTLGVVVALRDVTGRSVVKGPLWNLAAAARRDADAEEALRVFYVALTRAKERLYVVASPYGKKQTDTYRKEAALLRLAPLTYAYLRGPCSFAVAASSVDETAVEYWDAPVAARDGAGETCAAPAEDPALLSEMERRFSFVYPHSHLHRLPGTIAVSRLYPTVLDGSEEDAAPLPAAFDEDARPILPAFWRGESESDAADRGVATHLFLQFCDLDRLLADGVEAESRRLVERQFLTPAQAALVRPEEIETFRRSPWPAEMLGAARLLREFRFHVRLPAAGFTDDPALREALSDERILVQGVVDCLWEDAAGELTLIDYKTDRLTAAELRDPARAARTLLTRHGLQLRYYTEAMTLIFGKTPARIGVYSLHAGRAFWLGEDGGTEPPHPRP
ncbi:MAG: UvrD-helicase domain-containing protein, partial [Clostridia bacterium]|nr:UvrD-helicase domain-containing protein [Clostridia bacterium]